MKFSPSDFDKIARIVSENLVYAKARIKSLKKSDWRKMLMGTPSHPYQRELVAILNNTGASLYVPQQITKLTDFFIREEEIFLSFCHGNIDCNFRIFSKDGVATISWEDEDLQQNPELVNKVLMPILHALKQAGFGLFDSDESSKEKISKEVQDFFTQPSPYWF